MRASVAILVALMCFGGCLTASAQGAWESLGPGVGYRPEAFFVSRNAIYLGLSEEGGAGYLGLYRYSFAQQQWEAFAWQGYGVLGVSVWGESDENILILRFDELDYRTDALRSTDGGETWAVTFTRNSFCSGLTQAPTDHLRHTMHNVLPWLTTDGGWSWSVPGGSVPWTGVFDTTFDPSDAAIAYMTGLSAFGSPATYKSTDGGASWSWQCEPCGFWGIEVRRQDTNHVMAGGPYVSTDAGVTWSRPSAPFIPKAFVSPAWASGAFFGAGIDASVTTYEARVTTDLGVVWLPCGEGLPHLPAGDPYGAWVYLQAHPVQPVLYAALEGSGVWKWQYTGAEAPSTPQARDVPRLFAYPVPSSDGCTYGMRLPATGPALVQLFDTQGRLVRTLQEGLFDAGTHVFQLSGVGRKGPSLTSGVYYLKLTAGGVQERRTIVLTR